MRIDSERDKSIADWVISEFKKCDIESAVKSLGDRAWPTKVAAKLGKKIPDQIWDPVSFNQSEAIRNEQRVKLRALRESIARNK